MILFCFVCFCLFFVKGACIFIFYSVRDDSLVSCRCVVGLGFLGHFKKYIFCFVFC